MEIASHELLRNVTQRIGCVDGLIEGHRQAVLSINFNQGSRPVSLGQDAQSSRLVACRHDSAAMLS